jgi:hypothetical protein
MPQVGICWLLRHPRGRFRLRSLVWCRLVSSHIPCGGQNGRINYEASFGGENRAARKSWRQYQAECQVFAAAGIGAVASTLTALSLTHLAHGISIVTAAPRWENWAMAIGIDLGFVALEGAQLGSTSEKLRRESSKYTKPAITLRLRRHEPSRPVAGPPVG